MKKQYLFILLIFLIITTACRPGRTIIPVHEDFTGSYNKATNQFMRHVIFEACAERGWVPYQKGADLIEAKLIVRAKHTIVVSIPYTATSYSINYKNSINMEYNVNNLGVEVIHPNYNNWVNHLRLAINKKYATLAAKAQPSR
ncbi:MAG: hypothetical protein IJS50_00615 [Desulfovibrio sp.]|nr:hypothetical protein [Desulfovibrio sp.]